MNEAEKTIPREIEREQKYANLSCYGLSTRSCIPTKIIPVKIVVQSVAVLTKATSISSMALNNQQKKLTH